MTAFPEHVSAEQVNVLLSKGNVSSPYWALHVSLLALSAVQSPVTFLWWQHMAS